MKTKKGPRDADQGRREVAGACPKPAAPIASNGQPGNDADECHNDEDLQGSGHSGLSVAMRLASRSGACGEARTDSQGYNKQKPAFVNTLTLLVDRRRLVTPLQPPTPIS